MTDHQVLIAGRRLARSEHTDIAIRTADTDRGDSEQHFPRRRGRRFRDVALQKTAMFEISRD